MALIPYDAIVDATDQYSSFESVNINSSASDHAYTCYFALSNGGKTISWYNNDGAGEQLNVSGFKWAYFAWG